MIIKAAMSILILTQIVSAACAAITFGSLFLFMPESLTWHVNPARNIGLPAGTAVLCQAIIGLIIFHDAKVRLWDSELKCDLWSSLGRSEYISYNWSLSTMPLLSIAYFSIIMNSETQKNWWLEKQKDSAVFRFITNRSVMNFFLRVTIIGPFSILIGMLIFALGGFFNSDWFAFLGFKVFGGAIIFLPPLLGLFHFLVLTHFLSREWIDHSFEMYYKNYPMGRWPKHEWLDVAGYYKKVMRGEIAKEQ